MRRDGKIFTICGNHNIVASCYIVPIQYAGVASSLKYVGMIIHWSYATRKDLCDEHSETFGNSYLVDHLADLPPIVASCGQEW